MEARYADALATPLLGSSSPTRAAPWLGPAQHDLAESALCRLPGFFSAPGLAALVAEVRRDLLPRLQPTVEGDGGIFLPGRAFPEHSLLRQLFDSEEMEALVSALYGQPLYRSIDLDRALNLSVYRSGDSFGAHFDENACVVSLPLLTSEHGGEFQWAPFCHQGDDRATDGHEMSDTELEAAVEVIERIFGDFPADSPRPPCDRRPPVVGGDGGDGSLAAEVRTHNVVAGEMLLFNGRRSLHRVCTVGAEWRDGTVPGFHAERIVPGQLRVAALFSYSRQPGYWWQHARDRNEDLDPGYAEGVLPQYLGSAHE